MFSGLVSEPLSVRVKNYPLTTMDQSRVKCPWILAGVMIYNICNRTTQYDGVSLES